MSSLPVAFLDLIVVGVVIISALLAAVRGFTREVLAIASWGAAGVAALLLHPKLLPYTLQHISNMTVALVVTIAAIFLVTLVVVSLITVRLADFVLDSRIGALDRTLGVVFGAARGFLICVIGYVFFSWFVPDDKQPDWARQAKMRPFLETTGVQLRAMLPDDPEKELNRLRRPRPDSDNAEPPAEGETRPPGAVPTPAAPGRRS